MKKSFIAVLVILTSGHSVECFTDTCDYTGDGQQNLCGDICLNNTQPCDCGGQRITRGWFKDYCCAPASACTRTQEGASCSSGEVLSWRSPVPCNATGRCFNDFLTSQHLTYWNAKYTCQDKCIEMKTMGIQMCQGVNICTGDEEVCGPQLRCPVGRVTQYNMTTIPVRKYCYDDDVFPEIQNNGSYELLDRSDENLLMSNVTSAQSINYTAALAPCTDNSGSVVKGAGVMCERLSLRVCIHTARWCNDKAEGYCEDSKVWRTDPGLCSHPTFWQNISCNYYDVWTRLHYPGLRCTGAIKHCYYPQGSPPDFDLPTTCRDKSDRVFQVGEPCPDTPDNICQESCDTPGTGCLACTNTTYFRCPRSNKCIHPSLQCDGIPQCSMGEDEDLDICKNKYKENDGISKHKISQHATFRCKRKLNRTLETFAIACDDNPECWNNKDEKDCNQPSAFIKYSMASIAAIYLILKYGRKLFRKLLDLFHHKTHKVIKSRFNQSKIIREYFANHDEDDRALEEINCLLLNTIFTKTSDETKIMGKYMYALEEAKHKSNKNEIFACMHRNMNPLIMQTIIDSHFKGLTEKTIEFLEESFCCGRWITACLDYIRAHEWLTDLLNTIMRLVKIELQYLDVVKDTFLTFSLYRIVGGHQAIWDFPKEFSIVVILCLVASVVVPVVFATLHLVVHNPFLIVTTSDKQQTGWRRAAMTLVCCCLSLLNPILLVNNYERAKEKTRKMAKIMDKNTMQQMKKTKEIKEQLTSFVRIEHGNISIY